MALAHLNNPTCSKTQLHSSQLSFLSRTLPRQYHCTFAPLHRTQHGRITCSVAPK
jgi:malate dehydrogenase (NADP+)